MVDADGVAGFEVTGFVDAGFEAPEAVDAGFDGAGSDGVTALLTEAAGVEAAGAGTALAAEGDEVDGAGSAALAL